MLLVYTMERNTYAILGHSFHTNKNQIGTVPNKIHLYLPAKCGHVFSDNNKYRPILKSPKSTKNTLLNLEMFKPGDKFANQLISIGPKNSALYYGLYRLPNNIKNPKGNSLVNISKPTKILLSNLFKKIPIKNKNVNVIGVFCRNIAHFDSNLSYGEKGGKRTITTNGNNDPAAYYPYLRPITAKRRKISQAMTVIQGLMNKVPKGRRTRS